MKIKQILIICLILTNQVLFSQKIISHFRLYSSADGLPSNQLSCLTQDSYGYLWVGTLQGISRFNGTTFQNFNNEQSNFPAKCCTHLLQVNDSILFIGTSSGIVVYNLKINRFQNELLQHSVVRAGCGLFTHSIVPLPHHRILVASG